MPNNWYHTPKYGNETWDPKSLKTKVLNSVKRKAVLKEKIVVTKKHFASDFSIGNIFTVKLVEDEVVHVNEIDQGVYHWEYEVVTESEEVWE